MRLLATLTLSAATAALAAPAPAPKPQSEEVPSVTIFDEDLFQGESVTFAADVSCHSIFPLVPAPL
ncbi:uncharacterized protein BJX67DRAFT_380612 [Aspergillus lucknowensis]|uniref:Uncharacterized protein n=1 Tax=Aspergillus lucknowensis TaxID=176173 RepID=A0ABR4LSZ2_9EURO